MRKMQEIGRNLTQSYYSVSRLSLNAWKFNTILQSIYAIATALYTTEARFVRDDTQQVRL